jgi:hypothetical protein
MTARQADCFSRVARVLEPGGMFVVECFVPDLAERAGLQLRERHGDWDRRPFTSSSRSHVSVYQRA